MADSVAQRIDDDRRAMVSMLRELQQIEAVQADADVWVAAMMADHEEASSARRAQMALLHEGIYRLGLQMRVPGRQYVDVPGVARVQYRTTPGGVRVADKEAAIAWARDHERPDFIRRPPPPPDELVVTAYKEYAAEVLAAEGEVLPGVLPVPEQTSMKVEWRPVTRSNTRG